MTFRPYHLSLVAVIALLLVGCDQPRRQVDTWLEQEIAGRAPYPVSGVSNYTLVSHRIVKSANGIVTVELTFKNQRGGDVVETHNFQINGQGKVEMRK